jgi:hypothetical protein
MHRIGTGAVRGWWRLKAGRRFEVLTVLYLHAQWDGEIVMMLMVN